MTVVGSIARGSDASLGLLGAHPAMAALRDAIRRAAALPAPVVVWGPTGAGKEVVARALHEASPARARPFLPVNITALPDGLVESELFGSIRGAFTGAVTDRPGLFEGARGGTIFLDEAADLPLGVQLKLLRVLEYGEVRRVGATTTSAVEFRLVVATKESPHALKAAGRWREDLFYRLAAVALRVPPLREHRSDIPELVEAFLATRGLPPIDRAALDLLVAFEWPGNVRELQQVVLQAALVADGGRIQAQHVQQVLATWNARDGIMAGANDGRCACAERDRLLAACQAAAWDLARAASGMSISRATLYRRLRAHGVLVGYERRVRRLTPSHETA